MVPQGMRFQPLGEAQFEAYKAQLLGITEANSGTLTTKLIELGLQPNAGTMIK